MTDTEVELFLRASALKAADDAVWNARQAVICSMTSIVLFILYLTNHPRAYPCWFITLVATIALDLNSYRLRRKARRLMHMLECDKCKDKAK